MNKTINALKLAEEALNAMLTHMGMDEDEWTKPTFDQSRKTLAAIRETLAKRPVDYDQCYVDGFVDGFETQVAEQDHIANAGKMIAESLQILPGGGAFPFVEVGYVGEFVAPTKSLPAGTPLCVAPVQPVKQEPVAWTNYNGAVNNRLKNPAPVDAKAIRAEVEAEWIETNKALAKEIIEQRNQYLDMLAEAIDLSVKAEREACAKVCEDRGFDPYIEEQCAAAIRARSEK
jgi:hypothetical protein